MPIFTVRFKGLLFKSHREGLAKAGLEVDSSEEAPDSIFGEPIHKVEVETGSEGEAIEAVERAIGRDAFNFSDWEAGAAE